MDRTNSPTSARRDDGHRYIRIWATPPRRLVFWDGAPSSTSGIRVRLIFWDGAPSLTGIFLKLNYAQIVK